MFAIEEINGGYNDVETGYWIRKSITGTLEEARAFFQKIRDIRHWDKDNPAEARLEKWKEEQLERAREEFEEQIQEKLREIHAAYNAFERVFLERNYDKQLLRLGWNFLLTILTETTQVEYSVDRFKNESLATDPNSKEIYQRLAEYIVNNYTSELNKLAGQKLEYGIYSIVEKTYEKFGQISEDAIAETNDELEQWCKDSIAGNKKAADEFKAGKESALNGLKGPVMKLAKGKVKPQLVEEMLRKLLKA